MRAFVAIELPASLREAVTARVERIRSKLPAARWVRTEAFHLTLFFLGEVSAEQVEEARRRLEPIFARQGPFEMQLGSGGTFPPRRPARVAWVGVEAPDELRLLQGAVSAACARIVGEEETRAFHPHLTVARCRRPWPRSHIAAWQGAFSGGLGKPFPVREGVLMRSHLEPTGARYEVVHRFPLASE